MADTFKITYELQIQTRAYVFSYLFFEHFQLLSQLIISLEAFNTFDAKWPCLCCCFCGLRNIRILNMLACGGMGFVFGRVFPFNC